MLSDMHFTVALLGLKFKYWHIIQNRKILLAVCDGQSKQGCKDQESIQSSTTPDPGYQ